MFARALVCTCTRVHALCVRVACYVIVLYSIWTLETVFGFLTDFMRGPAYVEPRMRVDRKIYHECFHFEMCVYGIRRKRYVACLCICAVHLAMHLFLRNLPKSNEPLVVTNVNHYAKRFM